MSMCVHPHKHTKEFKHSAKPAIWSCIIQTVLLYLSCRATLSSSQCCPQAASDLGTLFYWNYGSRNPTSVTVSKQNRLREHLVNEERQPRTINTDMSWGQHRKGSVLLCSTAALIDWIIMVLSQVLACCLVWFDLVEAACSMLCKQFTQFSLDGV